MGSYISLFVRMESNGFYWSFIRLFASLWILTCFMGTYPSVWILMGPDKDALSYTVYGH